MPHWTLNRFMFVVAHTVADADQGYQPIRRCCTRDAAKPLTVVTTCFPNLKNKSEIKDLSCWVDANGVEHYDNVRPEGLQDGYPTNVQTEFADQWRVPTTTGYSRISAQLVQDTYARIIEGAAKSLDGECKVLCVLGASGAGAFKKPAGMNDKRFLQIDELGFESYISKWDVFITRVMVEGMVAGMRKAPDTDFHIILPLEEDADTMSKLMIDAWSSIVEHVPVPDNLRRIVQGTDLLMYAHHISDTGPDPDLVAVLSCGHRTSPGHGYLNYGHAFNAVEEDLNRRCHGLAMIHEALKMSHLFDLAEQRALGLGEGIEWATDVPAAYAGGTRNRFQRWVYQIGVPWEV